ncbi:MAG: hypothetical protein BRD57_04685 [Proteobacteria bacterium SW_6_67_9]|nr:MAG: hypothetical protein BRD57_04685 [Proteobacteria bacterium SW_6_67_9]
MVVDNQDQPIPGVTVRVEGTTRQAVTGDEGNFEITNAPVGPVHLIADGSTADVDGTYPDLSYNITTVSGVDNPLAEPIYMVELNDATKVWAGEKDVTLTHPEVPGFKLEVPAGSVTFPDGSKEGFLSVTQVNANHIPMTPPNGMQPQFIVTIQPTGARFDPPAKLTLPNVDGHPPGAQVEMYSFDHDLEQFVTVGLGTVSEDGTTITSNSGVGVVKAGWHCGGQPNSDGCCTNNDCSDFCKEKGDGCPPNCIFQEGKLKPQEPGNCQKERCGKNTPADDPPQDDPNKECKKCQDMEFVADASANGNECADGCGQCQDGECDIDEDKPKPDDQQDPRDCKTLLCGGGHNDKDREIPKDDTGTFDCKTKECNKGESETVKDEFDQPDTICTTCDGKKKVTKERGTFCGDGSIDEPDDCSKPGCVHGYCVGGFPDEDDEPEDPDPHDCVKPTCNGTKVVDKQKETVITESGICKFCTDSGPVDKCRQRYDELRRRVAEWKWSSQVQCAVPLPDDLNDLLRKPVRTLLKKGTFVSGALDMGGCMLDKKKTAIDAIDQLNRKYRECRESCDLFGMPNLLSN